MIGTSIAIIGAFLLLFAVFIVKDIVAAKRAVRRTVHYSVRESIGAYLMLFPALALICLFVLLPIVYSLGYAFTDYYLLRPNDVMQFDNPENPTILEDFIRAIGAEPVVSALRNECCGAYVELEDKSVPEKLAGRILDSMRDLGADSVITACPLCRYNLYTNRKEGHPPVYYFTELLAEALGVKEAN